MSCKCISESILARNNVVSCHKCNKIRWVAEDNSQNLSKIPKLEEGKIIEGEFSNPSEKYNPPAPIIV